MTQYIELPEVASTNTHIKGRAAELPHGTVVFTHNQTAGRGQKGNSWEAAPGKNATFSMLIKRPQLPVTKQFHLSEAVSVAIIDVLHSFDDDFVIKWPNDIYHRDSKIAGILIENSLQGNEIDYSVVGIGLNVNQERFVSDAPNPVSLTHITGRKHDVEDIMRRVCDGIERLTRFDGSQEQLDALHRRYLENLYRYDGEYHRFAIPGGECFMARIVDVNSTGVITLEHQADRSRHHYYFKEVEFIIPAPTPS